MSKGRKWIKIVVLIVIVLVILGAATAVYAISQKSHAEAAALKHAGLSESEVSGLYSKLDMDGLSLTCEVSFWTSDSKYEYEVTAFGHEVIHFDKENLGQSSAVQPSQAGSDQNAVPDGAETAQPPGQPEGQSVSVSEADAKAIVLEHAGIDESVIVLYQSKIDMDGGRQVYEIEFYAGDYEYEYEVDCTSGEILKYEREKGRP